MSPTKSSLACVRCSERKVKCDRQNPCGACVRHGVECAFPAPKVPRRKRRLAEDPLVDARLKRYEALLQEKGIDPDQVVTTPESGHRRESNHAEAQEAASQLPTPTSTVSGPQGTTFRPQLVHSQSSTKLVDNLWSRVVEEIHEAEDNPEEDLSNEASDGGASYDAFSYVLGGRPNIPRPSHPSSEQIGQLWQVFRTNVDPLTKLVHVPSLERAIDKAVADLEHIPRGFEALMFSIYSMAVLSLSDDECKSMLGEARRTLLTRYVTATKAALSLAGFMSSTSIVVLQALVLHIFSIRDASEPRAMWSLTGAAIRIAEGMGLRLDGTLLGLPPFETEMHRRIWWQLAMHDFRAAEMSGQDKFRSFQSVEHMPKKPTNVNDGDLYPGMTHPPPESSKLTDMIWIMFRTELASFAAAQKVKMQKAGTPSVTSENFTAMDDLVAKDGFIQQLEDLLETKYLRFCDPSQPLQLLALLVGRLSLNLIRFVAHHPRRWAHMEHVPASEQQFVWDIVMQLLEKYGILQSNPHIRRFAWSVPYFIQWHAVIHVLDTLRADPLHRDAVKAWQIIDALYENNLELLLRTNNPILMTVGNLCLKAFNARVTALEKGGKTVNDPPAYIIMLREQREAAKARREAALARRREQWTMGRETVPMDTDADNALPYNILKLSEPKVESQEGGQLPLQPQPTNATPAAGNNWTGDDAFWLSASLSYDDLASGTVGSMDRGTDAILAQAYWHNTPEGEGIDWEQWDAWIGSLNPVHSGAGMFS